MLIVYFLRIPMTTMKKVSILLGSIILWWISLGSNAYGYEPSLYEAERLQTAETLLWTVPTGMQKDIEQKLRKTEPTLTDTRERFCAQYLLYQLNVIAQQDDNTVTVSTPPIGRITQINDKTFTMVVDGQTYTKELFSL